MKKYEELMDYTGYNYERFCLLVGEKKKNSLVCFFGSGLSLCSNGWEQPFLWVIKKLHNQIKALLADIKENIDAVRGEEKESLDEEYCLLNSCITDLDSAKILCESKRYFEAGDLLQEIIQKSHESLWNCGYSAFSSFNDACVQGFRSAMASRQDAAVLSTYDNPYQYPAIFYLPYLKMNLITTNIEKSFEDICNNLGQSFSRTVVFPKDDSILEKWNEENHGIKIFYIHGHVGETDSLVMAKREYDLCYPDAVLRGKRVNGAWQLLDEVARTKSILFLGASLEIDRTVDIINGAGEIGDRHFIPIFRHSAGEKHRSELTKEEQIRVNEYDEYQTILHMLIRETASDEFYPYCNWKQFLPDERNDITVENADCFCEKYKKMISDSLTSRVEFDIIEINENWSDICYSQLLSYLYFNHLVPTRDNRRHSNGWSICRITDTPFTLNGTGVLHNYPLGNTIYVIGGENRKNAYNQPAIDSDGSKKIVKSIEDWQHATYQDHYSSPLGDELRVRVIVLPTPFSYRALKEKTERRSELAVQLLLKELCNTDSPNKDEYTEMLVELLKSGEITEKLFKKAVESLTISKEQLLIMRDALMQSNTQIATLVQRLRL